MAYEYERDEWRSAIRGMTTMQRDRALTERRDRLGIVGDVNDVEPEVIDDGDADA